MLKTIKLVWNMFNFSIFFLGDLVTACAIIPNFSAQFKQRRLFLDGFVANFIGQSIPLRQYRPMQKVILQLTILLTFILGTQNQNHWVEIIVWVDEPKDCKWDGTLSVWNCLRWSPDNIALLIYRPENFKRFCR